MLCCKKMHISRQGYYKSMSQQKPDNQPKTELHKQVLHERNRCGNIGGRKLYHLLGSNIGMGRDRFFCWLKDNHLLVLRKKRFVRTTDSRHGFGYAPNRIKDTTIDRPDQAWVSDITYLRTRTGFCYLALTMDLYSRKVLGYDVNDTLEIVGAQRALAMAQREALNTNGTIHHSDRGSQYASPRYIRMLQKKGMLNSMTKAGDCYENATAERLNGILKQDYGLGLIFESKETATKAVKQAIESYNNYRPHWALNFKTPDQKYQLLSN
jgi:transposase InsO family protein